MKLLLHCCCAPCSSSCIENLSGESIETELFWYNPNIHPYNEYSNRRNCLFEFASEKNLKIEMYDEYGLRQFIKTISPDDKKRCESCYTVRLEKTAFTASQKGLDFFSTSLLISPYQDHDAIKRIGEEAARKFNVEFFYRDFRPLFRDSQAASRKMGLYMQKYCGCIFSEEERYTKRQTSQQSSERLNPPANSNQSSASKPEIFSRLALLTGDDGLEKLKHTNVMVFGLGGVGGWAAEALVRSGIGCITIVDSDSICASNINRQIQATTLTLGLSKAETLKKRLLEINPDCTIIALDKFFSADNAGDFNIKSADYVIDAIDTVNHKLDLIETVCNAGVTLFSSMGMARKTDASQIKTASIWDTSICPLARLCRQGLRKKGFNGSFTVVYSDEQPQMDDIACKKMHGKTINGSAVTVTATAGMFLAGLVLRDTIQGKQ